MKRYVCDRCGEEVTALVSVSPWQYEFCVECYARYATMFQVSGVAFVIPDETGLGGTSEIHSIRPEQACRTTHPNVFVWNFGNSHMSRN